MSGWLERSRSPHELLDVEDEGGGRLDRDREGHRQTLQTSHQAHQGLRSQRRFVVQFLFMVLIQKYFLKTYVSDPSDLFWMFVHFSVFSFFFGLISVHVFVFFPIFSVFLLQSFLSVVFQSFLSVRLFSVCSSIFCLLFLFSYILFLFFYLCDAALFKLCLSLFSRQRQRAPIDGVARDVLHPRLLGRRR